MHTPPSAEHTIDTFVDFFRDRDHHRITGGSLVPPPGDPVLFTSAGMHPLTPYLEGRPHPHGRRLVGVQRCLRTTDLEEVGDASHLTVFEMLGSWSLGDYGGQQSLRWGYELLHDGYRIDRERMYVTVFGGDGEVEPDTQSLDTWRSLGLPIEVNQSENWWSNGPAGPCGPDSEIFIWMGESPPSGTPGTDDRWVETWNHVMMRYRRLESGRLEPLSQPNVDTGMGFERLLPVVQGKRSVFECDVFEPWMRAVPGLWELDEQPLRIVCDHARSSIVVIGDGVRPSNTGRGYVLRRLIRRLLTTLWRDDSTRSLSDLPTDLFDLTRSQFRQSTDIELARTVLLDEEGRFRDLLRRGRSLVFKQRPRGPLTEEDYRYLHDTHGLPRELVECISRRPSCR